LRTHSYRTWLINMGHDSFIWNRTHSYGTWLIHMGHDTESRCWIHRNCVATICWFSWLVDLFWKRTLCLLGSFAKISRIFPGVFSEDIEWQWESHMNELCHVCVSRVAIIITHEWVMSRVAPILTHEWVMSRAAMIITYEWITSCEAMIITYELVRSCHVWVSRVAIIITHEWVMSRVAPSITHDFCKRAQQT